MKKLKASQRKELITITEYLISGGAFFWSGYGVLILMREVMGIDLFISTAVSYTVGWIVNYVLQRYWVFENPQLKKQQARVGFRYIVISVVNLFINYAILEGLERIGISVYIGQFVSAGFFTVWNYLIYKFWVFYTPKKKKSPPRKAAKKKHAAHYHNHPGLPHKKPHVKGATR